VQHVQQQVGCCRQSIAQEQARSAEARAAQKAESDAAMQRHLDLIDRLLADKDALAAQVEAGKRAATELEAKHAAALEALKAEWAQELRKQKEAWMVAEKVCSASHAHVECACPKRPQEQACASIMCA
jgi:cob(I)alamin adenosyltransferase